MQATRAGNPAVSVILAVRRSHSRQRCEVPMKQIVLAAVFVIVASNTFHAEAQNAARRGTAVSQTQPTANSVRQAQSAKPERTGSEMQVDEVIQRNEREIRPKLIICRGC